MNMIRKLIQRIFTAKKAHSFYYRQEELIYKKQTENNKVSFLTTYNKAS